MMPPATTRTAAAALLLLALAAGCPQPEPAAAARANVVVIVADDLGWNDVGWRGRDIRTPRLDAIARRGVRLDAFRASPICTPSRARLMTGRYAIRHDLVGNVVPAAVAGLPPGERTLAERFRAAGYRTALVGKWHLGTEDRYRPEQRGFDHAYGVLGGWVDHFTHRRDGVLDWFRNGERVDERGFTADLVAAEAVRWLESVPEGEPFLLVLPFTEPHTPLQAPPSLVDARRAVRDPKRRVYGAMIRAMDDAVGTVLDAVARRAGGENTLVLFVSDNGGALRYGADNGPFRAGKYSVFEGGLRVPAAIAWPGSLPEGAVSEQPMTMLDVLPTLLDAIGSPADDAGLLDGESVWRELADGSTRPRGPLFFASEHPGAIRAAVLSGGLKLVCIAPTDGSARRVELYDVSADPGEREDLAPERPAVVRELFGLLAEWWSLHPRAASLPLGPPPD